MEHLIARYPVVYSTCRSCDGNIVLHGHETMQNLQTKSDQFPNSRYITEKLVYCIFKVAVFYVILRQNIPLAGKLFSKYLMLVRNVWRV